MSTVFDPWVYWRSVAWRPDADGQPYHVTNHDSGAGTAWGVTDATWNAAVRQGLVKGKLVDASQDNCGKVLYWNYWLLCHCDEMPAPVAGVVFNIAMVDGPGRAVEILQTAVGVDWDGRIGPITLKAVAAMDPAALVEKLTVLDDAYTDGLASAKWFGAGWRRRAEIVKASAMALITTPGLSQHIAAPIAPADTAGVAPVVDEGPTADDLNADVLAGKLPPSA